MNGAAMSCQQEQAPHPPQHNDSSSLHCPEYHLQTNYSCPDQNSQHQYSKAMNNQLLSDNFSVDGSSRYSQQIDNSDTRNRLSSSDDILVHRINRSRIVREPMELPVPKFEIDENSVGVFKYKKEKPTPVQDSQDLDLDTRIDLLIKSKALSGMHPIFSDLNDSNGSSSDSDESYDDLSKCDLLKQCTPEHLVTHQDSFDDPEKPLSRPPSPFLSRATYLFWFNKAIELKQQAKAQEKALLEKATKQLCASSLSSCKINKSGNSKHEGSSFLNSLLSEVSKEIKEMIKQEFIKETIENTILNSLEDWWVKETKLEEDKSSLVSSTTNDNFQLKDIEKTNEPLKHDVSQSMKLNSIKIKCISNKEKNVKSYGKLGNLNNHVKSFAESMDTTLNEGLDSDVPTGLEAKNVSSSCNEDGNVGTQSLNLNESLEIADPFSKNISSLSFEEPQANPPINNVDDTTIITAGSYQHQLSPVKENNSSIERTSENKFLDKEQSEISDISITNIEKTSRLEESSLYIKGSHKNNETEVANVNDLSKNEKNFSETKPKD